MRKKKVCFLFTGGTIGMFKNEKTGALTPGKNIDHIVNLFPEIQKTIDIDVRYLFNIDSSNMQPHHWSEIAETIHTHYSEYDGFVVAQGTDTMAYTACALSFALQNLGKPVVLTGAMMPLSELGSDGRSNVIHAIMTATLDFGEVVIAFGSKILRGNRTTKFMESFTNAFHSPNYPLIGEIYRPIRVFDWRKKRNSENICECRAEFNANIKVIRMFPGFSTKVLELGIEAREIDGIIFEAFGPGNIPFCENSLIPCIEKSKKHKIPFVIASQLEHGKVDLRSYEAGNKARELGVISAGDMTTECTTVKLMWALKNSSTYEEVKEIMECNISGELTVE